MLVFSSFIIQWTHSGHCITFQAFIKTDKSTLYVTDLKCIHSVLQEKMKHTLYALSIVLCGQTLKQWFPVLLACEPLYKNSFWLGHFVTFYELLAVPPKTDFPSRLLNNCLRLRDAKLPSISP